MNASITKHQGALWSMAYLAILGLGLYLSRGLTTLYSPYFLVLAYVVLGLLLSLGLKILAKPREGSVSALIPVAIFSVVQGAIGYALARYVFNLGSMEALAFPLGGLMALFGFYLLNSSPQSRVAAWVLAAFFAGGLALGLRLGGIQGGIFYGIGLLSSYLLGKGSLEGEAAARWGSALGFAGLLVVGRAALQMYLLESGYSNLGVVITHPYTFVALFVGLALPWMFREMEEEKCLPTVVILIALGVLLPWVLGIFIHTRPMGAYVMGVLFSTFVVGVVYSPSVGLALLAYLSLAASYVAMPWYRDLAKLSRWTRLEILAGVVLVAMVLAFLASRKREKPSA